MERRIRYKEKYNITSALGLEAGPNETKESLHTKIEGLNVSC